MAKDQSEDFMNQLQEKKKALETSKDVVSTFKVLLDNPPYKCSNQEMLKEFVILFLETLKSVQPNDYANSLVKGLSVDESIVLYSYLNKVFEMISKGQIAPKVSNTNLLKLNQAIQTVYGSKILMKYLFLKKTLVAK